MRDQDLARAGAVEHAWSPRAGILAEGFEQLAESDVLVRALLQLAAGVHVEEERLRDENLAEVQLLGQSRVVDPPANVEHHEGATVLLGLLDAEGLVLDDGDILAFRDVGSLRVEAGLGGHVDELLGSEH